MEDDFCKTAGEWLPWFKLENRERLLDMFAGWNDLTEKYGCTISQLTIAWTAAQYGATPVLCGIRTVEQGVQKAGAGALELEANEMPRPGRPDRLGRSGLTRPLLSLARKLAARRRCFEYPKIS